jgi:solute carrier family 12 sodium/potassium/chloride transporter 2
MNIKLFNFVSLQAQLGLLVILLVAIADFIIGTFIGPQNDEVQAKGFIGYDCM